MATNGNNVAQTNNYQVVIPPAGTITPTYDTVGEMTSNGNGQSYQWDAENRLVKITQGSSTYQFGYDAFGRRITETDNSTLAKQWIWSGATMAEERNASNSVTKRFYPQGEQISGSSYYYTFDHLGSIRELTNSGGTIQARYDYDPFGRVTLVSGTNLSDFQYAGYYAHQASGLNLTMYRAYDPNTAKWLSRDPLGEGMGQNLYDYVRNNPILAVDSLGLCGSIDCTMLQNAVDQLNQMIGTLAVAAFNKANQLLNVQNEIAQTLADEARSVSQLPLGDGAATGAGELAGGVAEDGWLPQTLAEKTWNPIMII